MNEDTTELNSKSYWILRHVRDHVVWWDVEDPSSGGYKTEEWLFERKDGSFAYGDDPLDFYSDWKGGDCDSDWDSDYDSKIEFSGDKATETPFGASFDAFCREREWESVDPSELVFPSHAMILLDGQEVMPWRDYKNRRSREEKSWEFIGDRPLPIRPYR